jgi:hypothetical protein
MTGKPRGLTFVTVLIVVGAAALIGWIVTYGPAYWDNTSVNRALSEAGNLCYRQPDDEKVKDFIINELHHLFDTGERGPDGLPAMSIDVQRDDVRVERTDTPKKVVHIWLTYHRVVKWPIVGQEREVTFVDHVEQDLSPVKW